MGKVINFHKVTDPKWFENVVCMLKFCYTIITVDQLAAFYHQGMRLPRRVCLITVDDGDKTSYTVIYPILKKHNIPAVFFVSPEKMTGSGRHKNFWFQEARSCSEGAALMDELHSGIIRIEEIWEKVEACQHKEGRENLPPQNMTLEQVKEIDSEGLVTIGAHTLDHPFLARENNERSAYEITASVSQLTELLEHPIKSFAYPNGCPDKDFGEREIETLMKTTCRIAFSTQAKDFTLHDSPYAIPRYGLSRGSVPFVIMKLLMGSRYISIRTALNSFRNVAKKTKS